MAKKQDFASKTHKSKSAKTCPVCGETYQYVKTVSLVPTEKGNGGYHFAERMVAVCKCNEKEIYG